MTWTCSDCGVEVRYAPGFEPPANLPAGWTSEAGELRCLTCRREEAIERHPSGNRALALIEFELRRDPDRRDAEIAKSVGVSSYRVGVGRRGALAAAELRRDPGRSDSEIARLIGASAGAVQRARRRLEADGAIS